MMLLLIFLFAFTAESIENMEDIAGSHGTEQINCQGKMLPQHYFNDDYCDCPDGSDEPDTSACSPVGMFKCKNKGHIAKWIKSSLLKDGLCDCCDGSDEAKNVCPNTCKEENIKYKKEQHAKTLKNAMGVERKMQFIQEAKKIDAQRILDLDNLNKTIQDMEAKMGLLKETEHEKRALAEADRSRICRGSIEKLRTWVRDLDKSLENLANIGPESIDSVKFSLDQTEMPNDNGMGHAYLKDPQDLEEDDDLDFDHPDVYDKIPEDIKDDDLDYDHPDEYDKIPEDINDFNEFCKPYMDKASVWIRALLSNVEKKGLWKSTDSEVIKKIKDELSALTANISQKKNMLENLKKKEEFDYGPRRVFAALDSKCFSYDAGQYSYEMCFFGSATQRFDGTQMHLGNWGKWAGPSDDPYSAVVFEHGTSCWNGPERSMKVRFSCGAEEKILSVTEPAKCEYLMNMETSAYCSDPEPVSEKNQERHLDL